MKRYLKINVYEAFLRRMSVITENFDNIIVAFSGGKDSGLLLHLVLLYLDQHKINIPVSIFHIDYEAQYTATTEFVDDVYSTLSGRIRPYRCCVPIKAGTCTSMSCSFWRPWDPEARELWVRELPKNCYTVEHFPFYRSDMWDYEFQEKFSPWHHEYHGARRTGVLIGIRAQESLNRWRTITSERNINKFMGHSWTTKISDEVFNIYPLYDWMTEDIWTANAKFGFPYNRLYDLYYQAGVPLHAMRVASPFILQGQSSLHLYRAIDPNIWGKMVSRVNGVNFAAIYGGTKAMGWKNITKPAHFSWREYMEFLLSTLPAETAANYREKLRVSIDFWRKRGGVLSDNAIADLRLAGIEFEVGEKTNYKTEKKPVRMEYADDIDSADFQLIPTYKRMCVCILKNDHLCKYMGFSLNKNEMDRRKAALEKYKDI